MSISAEITAKSCIARGSVSHARRFGFEIGWKICYRSQMSRLSPRDIASSRRSYDVQLRQNTNTITSAEPSRNEVTE